MPRCNGAVESYQSQAIAGQYINLATRPNLGPAHWQFVVPLPIRDEPDTWCNRRHIENTGQIALWLYHYAH
jgi:hypothetical protein